MNIILFGTGMTAHRLMSYPLRKEHAIIAVVDNKEAKWGTDFCGYPIKSPAIIRKQEYDIVLLAIIGGWMDVWQQLREIGVPKSRIFHAVGWSRVDYFDDPLDELFMIPKKPFVPFVKKPLAGVLGHCGGETGKAHDRRMREDFFDKYCQGEGLDIGCGSDPVTPGCSGWDLCNGDAQELEGVPDESFDFVYSSHCIEHMTDVRRAIANWFRVVKRGGYLIIYGPERDLYEKRRTLPSRFNPHHQHMFLVGRKEAPDTLDICEEIREALSTTGGHYRIEYIKVCHEGWESLTPEVQSPGEYSFEVIIWKM